MEYLQINSLVAELVSLEHQHEDLKLKCYSQENLILELQNSCDNFETELSDLKECNQVNIFLSVPKYVIIKHSFFKVVFITFRL